MNQIFPKLNIGDQNITFSELTLGNAISLAKMNQNKLEAQLTQFLRFILKDDDLPYSLTVQQRYYCLLQYLSAQKNNDLSPMVPVSDYLVKEEKPWATSFEVEDISVRQLTGLEIEALEEVATDVADWTIGAMALQISTPELPYIMPLTDLKTCAKVIKNRFDQLNDFTTDQINDLYRKYLTAEKQLASLVTTGFDKQGVVIFKMVGGDAVEPLRFQCDSTFNGFSKQLFSALAEGSSNAAAQLEDEFL